MEDDPPKTGVTVQDSGNHSGQPLDPSTWNTDSFGVSKFKGNVAHDGASEHQGGGCVVICESGRDRHAGGRRRSRRRRSRRRMRRSRRDRR